ncbi:MAG: DAK2 domain-containing protein [Solobacterium sp.]|nr:DAK2 domain-containing protein [Solobacterium sp.]
MDKINGAVFKEMLISGCNNLNNRKKEVDSLNVFPVPDGDTGTNMSLTFNNGISEVKKSGSESLSVIAKTLSRGLLMGARGNSGVILSQIFRGFQQSVGDQEELDVQAFNKAMLNGSKLAYKAVMRPVEGTILTVIRESSESANAYVEANPECSVNEYMDVLCKEAKASLDHTPELLPILKEARVVDSGGSGLVSIFDGFRAYLMGAPIMEGAGTSETVKNEKASGYRTEFILKLSDQGMHLFKEDKFRNSLSRIGESMTIIQDDDTVKVRMNTMQPGEVLNLGQRYGEFTRIQIDNLNEEQHPSIIETEPEEPAEAKEYGIITVAAGKGLVNLFTDYRADVVVSGGQTMNPSTEDFVSAIRRINAEHIFILPNNSNIIMAAQQAADVTEDKDIIVLPTKSIPQGLNACIAFNPDADLETNKTLMQEAVDNIVTGQITYAVRDTTVDGREIHNGDYMGLKEKDIILTCRDKVEAACALIDQICDEDTEIVTLIRGEDASEEETEAVRQYIEDHYDVDIDVQNGGQPVYCFILSAE